jgi:hypothetical protein
MPAINVLCMTAMEAKHKSQGLQLQHLLMAPLQRETLAVCVVSLLLNLPH